jgi:16S rRNA (adenine1518-N6/adenine1519-N6)-dimethyltransferase
MEIEESSMKEPTIPPLNVQAILYRYGIRPSKGLGQNFLVDTKALQRVVAVAQLQEGANVLEVGPGLGSLTRYLAAESARVVAVEVDRKLIAPLRFVLEGYDNVEIVVGDILETDVGSFFGSQKYFVVANIPYYITSALIRHLLETSHAPSCLVLTLQKEVARRICANPGDMSLLALGVQVYGSPKVEADIPARAFHPVPKVDSAVVRVDLYPEPLIPVTHFDSFFRLAKAGFSQKRKTLRNSLAGGLSWEKSKIETLLQKVGIDSGRRAETLDLNEWGSLTAAFEKDA